MTKDDSGLVTRIAGGDREAFAAFYDRHAATAYGLLVRMLGRGPEAEDILQETFWQVWKSARQYDAARGTPVAWLMLLARSRAVDQLRRSARRVPAVAEAEAEAVAIGDCPSQAMDRGESAKKAREALNSLPAEQRLAIQRAFFDGYTHVQIAALDGLSLGTVKTRIRLGMAKLRDILGAESVVKG